MTKKSKKRGKKQAPDSEGPGSSGLASSKRPPENSTIPRRLPKKAPKNAEAVFWGTLCWLCTLFFAQQFGGEWLRSVQARNWAVTTGIVCKWDVDKVIEEGKKYYTPYPTFLFGVNGQTFQGSSANLYQDGPYGFRSFLSLDKAIEALRPYPIGIETKVYYDPDRPYDAVLDINEPMPLTNGAIVFLGVPIGIAMTLGFLMTSGYSRARVGGLMVLSAAAYFVLVPFTEGNCDEVEGGVALYTSTLDSLKARRQAWDSLRLGQTLPADYKVPEGGLRRGQPGPEAPTVRFIYQGSDFERHGELILKRQTPESSFSVTKAESPFYPLLSPTP